MTAAFVDGSGKLHGILALALAGVEAGRLTPLVEEGKARLQIDLGIDRDAFGFLRLERDPAGDLWVYAMNLEGQEIDNWHELELVVDRGEAREHSVLRRLWQLCRNRVYPAETEEVLGLLEDQFSDLVSH